MANILVDPIIVAIPAENEAKEEIEKWLNHLERWLEETENSLYEHNWLYCQTAQHKLWEDRRYPSFDSLRALVNRHSLNFNPQLLSRKLSQFFRDKALEKKLEDLGYLVEAQEVEVVPDQFAKRWSAAVQEGMYSLLAIMCVCKYQQEAFVNELSIATLALDDNGKELEVSATILAAEPDFEHRPDNKITQTFPLLFIPDDFPLMSEAEWPDLGKLIDQYFKTNLAMQNYPDLRNEPIPFECSDKFWKSIAQYCNNAKMRDDLTKALAKKVYGMLDASLGDEQLTGRKTRRFRVTRFWRVHYYQQGEQITLDEFGPHNMGLQ